VISNTKNSVSRFNPRRRNLPVGVLPKPINSLALWGLALAVVLSACSESAEVAEMAAEETSAAIPVCVATVERRSDDELLRFSSTSRVRQRASLTFQVGGVIETRSVEIGEQVSAGQTLMTLYSPALQPAAQAAQFRLEQLQADKTQADRELERLKTLYERGVIPMQELEQQATRSESLVSAVNNARATAEQAESLLRESQLIAPFSGSVEQILVEPGEFAQPGQAVLRIASADQLEAEIRVPAHLTQSLIPGQELTITHTDGFPVQPRQADAVVLGMGERLDVLITLGDQAVQRQFGVLGLEPVEPLGGVGPQPVGHCRDEQVEHRQRAGVAEGADVEPLRGQPGLHQRTGVVEDGRAALVDDVGGAAGQPAGAWRLRPLRHRLAALRRADAAGNP
jgi:multidrug efflux pump subunit AcrA (membrane-fusion protein)